MIGLTSLVASCAHVFPMGSSSGLELPHDSLHSALALHSDWGEGESSPEPEGEREKEPDKWSHALGDLLSADPVIKFNMEEIHWSNPQKSHREIHWHLFTFLGTDECRLPLQTQVRNSLNTDAIMLAVLKLCLEILTYLFYSAAIVWFFCNVAFTPYTKSLFNKENRVIFEFMPVFASTSVTVKR